MSVELSRIVEQRIQESILVKSQFIANAGVISDIATQLIKTIRNDGCIFTCGNGGSSCDAMHFVEELVARYKRERPGIKAQHLCDVSTITCWANDYDYQSIFERQVTTFIKSCDALVAFSTSGNSENVNRALAAAKQKGAFTILFSGKDGGKGKSIADCSVIVPSQETARIQEAHIMVVHILCELIENAIYPI
ncbi:MAG: SIS domain-containing protein [Deltaproteobacteria bacterium]|nr:SIS domain-containing protein [Deltaproteobacteria bacterium]